MKILIIGFQRSGTTLLRRLLDIHPDIQIMIHEDRILKKKKNVEAIKQGFFIYNKRRYAEVEVNKPWGEKVPWYGISGNDAVTYSKKWLSLFGDNARVIHIIRNINDVVNSNLAFKSVRDKKEKIKEKRIKSVWNVRERLCNYERYMEITFEDLVTKPKETMEEVLKFCNLRHPYNVVMEIVNARRDKLRYFDRINPKRAFAYRGK